MKRTLRNIILIPIFFLLIVHLMLPLAETSQITTKISATQPLQTQLDHTLYDTTITLLADTYTQPFTIATPLTLEGTPRHTIINVTSTANSYAIHITTPNVTLKNLIIENHGPGLYTTGIKITATHVRIINCTIRNTPVGIAIWSDNILIENCIFENCDDEGIALLGSPTRPIKNTIIRNCTFINNCDGIEFQNAHYTTIQNCIFTNHTHAAIDAIGTYNSNTTIDSCEIHHSAVFDIYLANTENTTIADSVYTVDKLYHYRSTNTKIQKNNNTNNNSQETPREHSFSTQQYYNSLLERLQGRITRWFDQLTKIKTIIYEK